jgi:hypothetical protein
MAKGTGPAGDEESKQRQPGDLRQDELIERLVPDPSQIPDLIVLAGFLGRSNRDGYWRLYFTPELNDYIEFSEQDVRHTVAIPPELSPMGGTQVWLRRDADVRRTSTVSRQTQAEFLQGDIIADYQSRAAGIPGRSSIERLPDFGGWRRSWFCGSLRACRPTLFCGSLRACEPTGGACFSLLCGGGGPQTPEL